MARDWTVWERTASGWDLLIDRLPEGDARSVADQRNQTSADFALGTSYVALPAGESPEAVPVR